MSDRSALESTPSHPREPLRVVQWATGNIGMHSLRAVIEHPRLNLAGVFVHSAAKEGRDAGELCGLGPVGIKATRSLDEILSVGADCVLYMQQGVNLDDLCRLLASGTNVVTTRGEFHNPARMNADDRTRVEEACRRGKSSLHSTGSSPGFVTEALPIVLTSLQRRVDCLRIHEYADLSSRNSPELLFGLMGFGQPPNPVVNEGRAQYLCQSFGPSLEMLVKALGLSVDSFDAVGEVACAKRTTSIAAGVIEAGKVAAQRTTVRCLVAGRSLIEFTANWYCTSDLDTDWELGPTGWRLGIDGDVPMDVNIRFPVPAERWASVSPGLTAHRAVNAVPFVCAAPPGIQTTIDLPSVVADLAERSGA
ncbi:MAG: hypothetical protein OXU20_11245 [Myxococcales bacterium]|nr:hypothetical protein [Myxococcales bacterium]